MVLDKLLSDAKAARLSDDYSTAMRLARAVIAAAPGGGSPEAESLLGVCEIETGNLAAGAPLVENAANAKPDSPWLQLNLSALREAQGDTRGAVVAASTAARLAPSRYEPWTALGRLLGRVGKFGEAAAALKTAFRLNREHSGVARLYAGAAIEADDLDGAEAAVAALERSGGAPDLGKLRLGLFKRRGDWARLENEARRMIIAHPDDETAHLALAESLSRRGRFDDAVEALRKLPPSPGALAAFGHLMLANKHYEKARASFDQAIEKDPNCAEALLGRCRLHIESGDLPAAEADCRAAIRAGAPGAEAYTQLKELTGGAFTKEEVAALGALAEDAPEASRGLALFTLGDILHARGEHRAAFASWTAGNRAAAACDARANAAYDSHEQEAICARMRALFSDDPGSDAESGASAAQAPIFLLALPLSGAGELEAALGAHQDIASAGEVPTFPRIVDDALRWAEQTGWAGGELPEKEAAEWREAYFFGRSRFIRRPGLYVVDREPGNALGAGFARALFPEARFICLRRDLVEWSLLAYRSPLSRAYPFATDFSSIAHYAAEHARLCAHWAACFSAQFAYVEYEELVADGAGALRRLAAFLGLPPQDESFERHLGRERVIGSARGFSSRRPFAPDTDDRATFADMLEPVADALKRAGVDPGTGRYAGRIH
jgi:tetratricopeptide (TPR) repeat protein